MTAPVVIGTVGAGEVPKYESKERFSCMITTTCRMAWMSFDRLDAVDSGPEGRAPATARHGEQEGNGKPPPATGHRVHAPMDGRTRPARADDLVEARTRYRLT